MPLIKVKNNTKVKLNKIIDCKYLKKKLLDMGLTKGTEFWLLEKTIRGPIIIKVRESRLALGRSIAEKIDVDIVKDNE